MARSSLTPGPRPGYRSPDGAADAPLVELLAPLSRAGVGVLFVWAALLFLPVHFLTPIMTGMGILMASTGSYGLWRAGRRQRRRQQAIRVAIATLVGLVLTGMAIPLALGPGAFAPTAEELAGARPRVFVPPGYGTTAPAVEDAGADADEAKRNPREAP